MKNNLEPVTKRDHLEPVNSRKSSLTPRAKIGDVVIVRDDKLLKQLTVARAYIPEETWAYDCCDDGVYNEKTHLIFDGSILKNLTTNVSYE